MFNPLSYPLCFTPILRLAPSTWAGHTPFAMFLTDLLRPQVFVELGTYYGTSYCAFCQAVKELNIDAKCFAIDTWRGDSQSGFFGNEVMFDLKNYHDKLYGDFSRLIQSTFDDALTHFDIGTIDLLHIDGFHTYDAVKSDFEKWLPKMSERGVMLFHDINVRERDFGVWHLWDEIKIRYPSFEFIHSHGLGVLAVGKNPPDKLLEFLNFAEKNSTVIREFFYQLGSRFETILENLDLRKVLENRTENVPAMQDGRETLKHKRQNLEEETAEAEPEIDESLEEQLVKLRNEKHQLFAKRLELEKAVNEAADGEFDARRLMRAIELKFGGAAAEIEEFKFVIGVVTYNNSSEQIERLTKSISIAVESVSEMDIKFEVFVIDNGHETFWDCADLSIAKHASQGNIGFAKAMNHLMAIAFAAPSTNWFLCLNPDGALHYNALNELIKMSRLHLNSLIEARQFPEEHLKKYDTKTLETYWASGACLLIPRIIYEKTRGFDPNFFMYLEDIDLSWRTRAAGFSVKLAPKALFGHSVLNRPFSEATDKEYLLSGRYLAHKWRNKKFFKWTERELLERGYFSTKTEFPELLEMGERIKVNGIATFKHFFHFSPTRKPWS